MSKIIFDKAYIFGKNKLIFKKGSKAENDYLIWHNKVQITDLFLFNELFKRISLEQEAKDFLDLFCGYRNIKFNNDSIICNPSPLDVDDLYKYCVGSKLNTEQQELLFVCILRCDIDNICYPPPKLNGCIRIFVQVLLLFTYKFKWIMYYLEDKVAEDLDVFVYKIGFPRNRYDVDKTTFLAIYRKYIENKKTRK
ncbi:MAG: hypothetical protein PHO70_01535 [Candidatus Omnitrophica bacterium]|nr:hypothetical protein [Candidatus Omnitrophota bacterium]